MGTDLPTAGEALRNAVQSTRSGDYELGRAWTYIAREIREGSCRPEPGDRLTLHDVEGIVCAHGRVAVRRRGGPGVWFLHTDDGSTCDDPDEHRDPERRRGQAERERLRFGELAPVDAQGQCSDMGSGEPFNPAPRRPLLDAGQRYEDDPAATAVIADVAATTRMDLREGDTTQLTQRFRVPGFLEAETEYELRDGKPICVNCVRSIDLDNHEYWRHILTGQRACSGDAEGYRPGAPRKMAVPRVVPKGSQS